MRIISSGFKERNPSIQLSGRDPNIASSKAMRGELFPNLKNSPRATRRRVATPIPSCLEHLLLISTVMSPRYDPRNHESDTTTSATTTASLDKTYI